MSLSRPSSESAEAFTMSRNSRCSEVRSVSSVSSVMPMMPFMGVRISWLMLARNSLLASLACSAASLARSSACSARVRSRISFLSSMSPLFDARFKAIVSQPEFGIALLNLAEHLVEAIEQQPDFIVKFLGDAQRVISTGGNFRGGRGELQNRFGNDALQAGG